MFDSFFTAPNDVSKQLIGNGCQNKSPTSTRHATESTGEGGRGEVGRGGEGRGGGRQSESRMRRERRSRGSVNIDIKFLTIKVYGEYN